MADPDDILTVFEADTGADAGRLFTDLVARYLADTREGRGPVSRAVPAAELDRRFDEPLPREGRPLADVVARLEREIVADANRLYHPMYLGHQVSAPLPAAIWTEPVISALNNSLAVTEMSPTATAVEHRLIRWFTDLAGYGPEGGGTLTSGGTEATFTALLAARAVVLPDAWQAGVGADPPVVLHGEHAHYAVTRAVAQLGLGLDAAIAIPSRDYRMDPDALATTIARLGATGRRIMAVVATAGSTATGSFDDLETIGRLCEARGLWLHVDGAHGASALLSARHRHRLAGLARARSLAWDPHKGMLLPLATGLVLFQAERQLNQAFAQRAPYLFHGGEGERVRDQGVRSFQCSRRTDALKLWVALQRYGADGIGRLYDRLCDTAMALHAAIAAEPGFAPLHEPESNILCFRYVGTGGREEAELDRLNLDLRRRCNGSGAGWITTTILEGRRVLRVTVMNPRSGETEVRRLVRELARLAQEG
jgi:glutamate/tyrosine decarboxylase-like PLP-dependent enzyme